MYAVLAMDWRGDYEAHLLTSSDDVGLPKPSDDEFRAHLRPALEFQAQRHALCVGLDTPDVLHDYGTVIPGGYFICALHGVTV